MRIRTIKPEYWQHAMHEGLSREASILGAALQNFADDEGRGEAVATKIQGLVVPAFPMDVGACLQELAAIDFLILYRVTVDKVERRLFQIVTFARHQSINKWTASVLPPPPGWVFRCDPKPENWDVKKVWRRGRWYRVEEVTPGGLREDSGSGAGDGGGVSPASVSDQGERGGGGGSSLARAQMGKGIGREEEEKETEGEGGAVAPRAPVDRYASDASIPTEGEVVAFAGMHGIDEEYGRRFWRKTTNEHGWVKNRRLIRWENVLGDRWQEDRAGWLLKKNKNGVGDGGALPAWRQVEGLKRRILEHPANRGGSGYEPGCSEELKRELAGLEGELVALEKGGKAT